MSILVALQGGTAHDVTITESVTASDSQIAVSIAVGVLTESLSATAAQTGTFTAIGLITESVASGESQTTNYEANVTITETVAAIASQTTLLLAEGLLAEAVTATESQVGTYTTDATASEAGTANESEVASVEFVGLVNESAGASESSVSVVGFTANLTETIEATESNDGQIEGDAQVFDADLAESLSANDLSVAFTVSAPASLPVSLPSTGGGYAPRRWRPIPQRRPILTPTYRRSASLTSRVFARDSVITFNVTVGNVSESLNAADRQSANVVVGNSRAEFVSARSEADSSCEFACIITESITISDHAEAEVIPWILETIKVDGATLYLHNNATISLDLEDGVTIDVTVSKGETSGVLEIPICELIDARG